MMNIFATSPCPRQTANEHCIVHRRKMILEHCQLLSTAHRELDGVPTDVYEFDLIKMKYVKKRINIVEWDELSTVDGLECPVLQSTGIYRQSHTNHPSAVWTRESHSNYMWLVECTRELLELHSHFTDRTHACERVFKILSSSLPSNIPDGKMTSFKPAMPDEYQAHSDDVHVCYQAYVNDKLNRWGADCELGLSTIRPDFDTPLPIWRNTERNYV